MEIFFLFHLNAYQCRALFPVVPFHVFYVQNFVSFAETFSQELFDCLRLSVEVYQQLILKSLLYLRELLDVRESGNI